ncbi:MAG TPA: hypothetical protein PKH39_19175 [Woeseiaceae bacterium]|nr:hypothetical protein [Woeseiaceae bacterium]
MKQYIAIPTAILIVLGVAIDANAEDKGERRGPPSFAEIDTNADSLISMDEIEAHKASRGHKGKGDKKHKEGKDPQARFNKVDADGDGYWSEAEFDAAREKMRERRHERHNRHKREKADEAAQDDSEE